LEHGGRILSEPGKVIGNGDLLIVDNFDRLSRERPLGLSRVGNRVSSRAEPQSWLGRQIGAFPAAEIGVAVLPGLRARPTPAPRKKFCKDLDSAVATMQKNKSR